jgi:hypothetical protein
MAVMGFFIVTYDAVVLNVRAADHPGGSRRRDQRAAMGDRRLHTDVRGTASDVFNTSRHVGGALAITVFGGLRAHPAPS